MTKSFTCHGCKFLYEDGQGYSDCTWEDTFLTCALHLNDKLPIEQPYSYNDDMTQTLRWMATLSLPDGCEKFSAGEVVCVTPDGNIQNFTSDDEQMRAIIADHTHNDNRNIDLEKCRKNENIYGEKY